MFLGSRLILPVGTSGLLLDLDGVVVDSLAMDYELVNSLLTSQGLMPPGGAVAESMVRECFPLALEDFWPCLLNSLNIACSDQDRLRLIRGHELARETVHMRIHEGILEILKESQKEGLPVVLVSNNPTDELNGILERIGLAPYFAGVVGNDVVPAKKPDPAPYLVAVSQIGLNPASCVAVEDSLVGVSSAAGAGCYVVGVATGSNSFQALSDSQLVHAAYRDFSPCNVTFGSAGVLQKSISTPNEFVSHMLEHIAWRLGSSIDVTWTNDNWRQLGVETGRALKAVVMSAQSVTAFGMIDDGSCEVTVRSSSEGGVSFRSSAQVDLDWFLGLRCEQLHDGRPLVELIEGLGAGSGLSFDILIGSVEDPHHSWESIFRGIGIALERLTAGSTLPLPAPTAEPSGLPQGTPPGTPGPAQLGWRIDPASVTRASLARETAESVCSVEIELGTPGTACRLDVGQSLRVGGVAGLLQELAQGCGLRIDVDFVATRLSSSHVVMEDIGLALGRALREMAVVRMFQCGIYGAGSNIASPDLVDSQPVRVGISMEGRKFWKWVPLEQSYAEFRRRFLIGQTLPSGLYSEDLDDFIDGLTGGMRASMVIHCQKDLDPGVGWALIFRGIGTALAGLLAVNPARRSLTAGVKATLA